jgi:hypothetical protein
MIGKNLFVEKPVQLTRQPLPRVRGCIRRDGGAIIIALGVMVVVTIAVASPACAQIGGGAYVISRSIASAGGGVSGGGAYQLGGTAGQAAATSIGGGSYVLSGGFWVQPSGQPVAVGEPSHPLATTVTLSAPNPFRRGSQVAIDLPSARRVRLGVFAVNGRRVRELLDAARTAGRHAVVWNGTDDAGRRVSPGVYVLRLEAGPTHRVRRVVLVE